MGCKCHRAPPQGHRLVTVVAVEKELMSNNLNILDITLSRRRRSLPHPVDGHRDIWFDVTINVKNPGDSPLYVVNELRGISYDNTSHTLTLRLFEPAPAPLEKNAPLFHLPAPRTATIEPGATVAIVVADSC